MIRHPTALEHEILPRGRSLHDILARRPPHTAAIGDAAIDRLVAEALGGDVPASPPAHLPVHLPPDGQPCILLRRFERDVLMLEDARADGVYDALANALTHLPPSAVIGEVRASQLRSRGGDGFPTVVKLDTVRHAVSPDGRKFVVVNADDDADGRIGGVLLERDPHTQLAGALLAAYACGAQMIIFRLWRARARAIAHLQWALEQARAAGWIGEGILGSEFCCEVRVVRGRRADGGEENALLRSIDGVPDAVGGGSPLSMVAGLWGCPTAVHDVETIHHLPWILEHGGDAWAALGLGSSRGTRLVSLNARVRHPGLYEVELGTTLRELLFEHAGGMAEGQRFKAVQVGGPRGAVLPEALLDTPLGIDEMAAAGGLLGGGEVVVYGEEDDLPEVDRSGMSHRAAGEGGGRHRRELSSAGAP